MTPDKCPQCGAEENGDCEGEGTLYSCESYEPTGEQFVHSDLCIERSARQKAEEELRKVQGDLAETRKQLEREESEHTLTIKQRDDAERAADRIAELILGVDSLGGDKYVWWANAAERFVELECELNKWRYSENLQPQADLAAAKAEVERWKAVGKAFWRAMKSPSDYQWDLLCEAQFAATTLIESERR